jgi:hypothetical protein
LREFVNVGFPHKVTERVFPWVVLCGLERVGVMVDFHASEFYALEHFAIHACALLLEVDRPWRCPFYY